MRLKPPFLPSNSNPQQQLVEEEEKSRTRICHPTPKSSGSPNVVSARAAMGTNTDVSAVPNRACARVNALLRRVPRVLLLQRLRRRDNGNQPCRDLELAVATEVAAVVVVVEEVVAVVADADHKCADSLPVPGDVVLATVAAFLMVNKK